MFNYNQILKCQNVSKTNEKETVSIIMFNVTKYVAKPFSACFVVNKSRQKACLIHKFFIYLIGHVSALTH